MKDTILKGATLLFACTLMMAAMLKAQGCDGKSQVQDDPAAVEVEEPNTNGETNQAAPETAPATAPVNAVDAGTDAGDMGGGKNAIDKEPVLMPATKSGAVFRPKGEINKANAPVQQQQAPE